MKQAEKDGILPQKMSKLNEKFWNCLAAIMEHQLQRLCLKSIADYMDLLKEIDVSLHFSYFYFSIYLTHSYYCFTFPNTVEEFSIIFIKYWRM